MSQSKVDGLVVTPIKVAAGVIVRDSRVLIAKRPMHKPLGGLWEFPGGKVEPEETPFQALKRELHEELNINVLAASAILRVQNDPFELHFYWVDNYVGKPLGNEGQAIKWIAINQLTHYRFPTANQSVIQWLLGNRQS